MKRLPGTFGVIFGLLLPAIGLGETPADSVRMLGRFDVSQDLFLAQFDSKTDVDDIHSVAAVATMLSHADFEDVKYHAVAGAYGIQEGLYVPSPELFEQAFAGHWSDAHNHYQQALSEVAGLAIATLQAGGDVWVAEAGQSDFSADVLRTVREQLPQTDTQARFHIVQHSEWNQDVTDPEALSYVRQYSNYHKIADGNAENNGTPGFRTPETALWQPATDNIRVGHLWRTARAIGDKYNGQQGRYNNEAIAAGGMDFSDTAETCWIFGFEQIKDSGEFFAVFAGE